VWSFVGFLCVLALVVCSRCVLTVNAALLFSVFLSFIFVIGRHCNVTDWSIGRLYSVINY
jgi:hypothetical protein